MIPFTDLKIQYLSIKNEINEAIQKVFRHSQFILGPEVKLLEDEIAQFCGVKYAVGVASGTDALVLALIASGVKPGDKVITTPLTFIATTEAIVRVGAIPVFVDIDENTYNIDVSKIEEKIDSKTKAILPVHLYGQCCDMDKILKIAKKYNLIVIEDCAQAMGAEYKNRKAGSMGDAGCLSFFPAKNLGCYGDGGMIVTNSIEIAEKADILRKHGCKIKNFQLMHGFNSRLDTIQAAVLRVKLKYLKEWIEYRRKKAETYIKLLSEIESIDVPYIAPYGKHAFNYFTIRVKKGKTFRDNLQKFLNEKGISCGIYYPLSIHLQITYKNLGYKKGDFPISEQVQDEILSLPLYPEIEQSTIEFIVKTIKEFIELR